MNFKLTIIIMENWETEKWKILLEYGGMAVDQ